MITGKYYGGTTKVVHYVIKQKFCMNFTRVLLLHDSDPSTKYIFSTLRKTAGAQPSTLKSRPYPK
jgi:hypothetical protein